MLPHISNFLFSFHSITALATAAATSILDVLQDSRVQDLKFDLPNYAQHTVPIFSLPQEWLWCVSRCGHATKPQAKTVDLCNNPMTKEPKLQGAKRIVAEWPELEYEARRFTAKILGEDQEGSTFSRNTK